MLHPLAAWCCWNFLVSADAELLPDKRRQMDRAIADRVQARDGMTTGVQAMQSNMRGKRDGSC
ncbi:hypothetical protein DQG23_25790 [Paenibacillus contaminans]|uniref:Uncharacterized protein n=1 Tax=Paenibacillus contaminans TaxID=450362 RepID=A0A329MJI9_9BACL|nr:hypothetical protein DQG23_25790 [Paenibacillus contaminans]